MCHNVKDTIVRFIPERLTFDTSMKTCYRIGGEPFLILNEADRLKIPSVSQSIRNLCRKSLGVSFWSPIQRSNFKYWQIYGKEGQPILVPWDEGEPKKAFDKAINNANKVAMSLSDQFCVDRHKPHFLELVKNKLDIVFANEQEILSLIDGKSLKDIISFSKHFKKDIIITRGEKGAVAINFNEVFECQAKEGLSIRDLTGAGDLFAAGYLHGYINKLSKKECLLNFYFFRLNNHKKILLLFIYSLDEELRVKLILLSAKMIGTLKYCPKTLYKNIVLEEMNSITK